MIAERMRLNEDTDQGDRRDVGFSLLFSGVVIIAGGMMGSEDQTLAGSPWRILPRRDDGESGGTRRRDRSVGKESCTG